MLPYVTVQTALCVLWHPPLPAQKKAGDQLRGVYKVIGAVAACEEKQPEDKDMVAQVEGGDAHVGRGEEDMGVVPFAPVAGEQVFLAAVIHRGSRKRGDDGGNDVFQLLFLHPAVHGGKIPCREVGVNYHHGIEACMDAFQKADTGKAVFHSDFFIIFFKVVVPDGFEADDKVAEANLGKLFDNLFIIEDEITPAVANIIFSDSKAAYPGNEFGNDRRIHEKIIIHNIDGIAPDCLDFLCKTLYILMYIAAAVHHGTVAESTFVGAGIRKTDTGKGIVPEQAETGLIPVKMGTVNVPGKTVNIIGSNGIFRPAAVSLPEAKAVQSFQPDCLDFRFCLQGGDGGEHGRIIRTADIIHGIRIEACVIVLCKNPSQYGGYPGRIGLGPFHIIQHIGNLFNNAVRIDQPGSKGGQYLFIACLLPVGIVNADGMAVLCEDRI